MAARVLSELAKALSMAEGCPSEDVGACRCL